VVALDERPALGEWVNDLAKDFNGSQKEYKVVPTFKGTYPESIAAAIAAFRAGNAPAILQVFEVGTATMMASKGAIKPVAEVMKASGLKFDPSAYVSAVSGYYTAPNGQMLSMPFNSSTTMLLLQQGRLQGRGIDTEKAAVHLAEVALAAAKLKASGHKCPFTTSWQSWTQLESFSAWHNVEFATKKNGFGGMDTRLAFNSPLHVRHIENLANMAKQRPVRLQGPQQHAGCVLPSGECAMYTGSSGLYGSVKANAKFAYRHGAAALLPRRSRRTAEHRDRWRQSVGDGRQEARGVQGRGRLLQLHQQPRGAGRQPPAHRLPADHHGGFQAHRAAASTRSSPAPTSRRTR
jgi:sn-glycerol 3-phosphate transport system substrate-binding protein